MVDFPKEKAITSVHQGRNQNLIIEEYGTWLA